MSQSRYNVGGYRWENVRASFLSEGDSIDLNTWEITIRSDKTNIAGNESRVNPLTPSTDIFNVRSSPEEFTRHMLALVDSSNADTTYGLTYESNPRYLARMSKDNGTGYKSGSMISFTDMRIDFEDYGNFEGPEYDSSYDYVERS